MLGFLKGSLVILHLLIQWLVRLVQIAHSHTSAANTDWSRQPQHIICTTDETLCELL